MGRIASSSFLFKILPVNLAAIPNALAAAAAAVALIVALRLRRSRVRTPRLNGPPSKSFLFGVAKDILNAPDAGVLFTDWERQYGAVYEVSAGLGSRMLVLGDSKGIAHFFANDTTRYNHFSFTRTFARRFTGENLVSTEGETHKRQRRAISPSFSISLIRSLLPAFLEPAKKLTVEWNTLIQSQATTGFVITDVQRWMNYVSLDSVGKAAFSHDFQSVAGGHSPVIEALDAFSSIKPTFSLMILLLIGPLFPKLALQVPTERTKALRALSDSAREIAGKLLVKEREETGGVTHNSILKALIRSETGRSNASMSIEEIMSQQLLMIAGYESTATTLTWALIELARNHEIQKVLRAELEEHVSVREEIGYEKLMNDLPYLDAFICEVLRLHPAVPELLREAVEDDNIPLGKPIVAASGALIENLPVATGTMIRIPLMAINRSEALWGPDAAVFDPTRWLIERPGVFNDRRKEEIHGYRHLLSFGHGPRVCIGRNFALTEIKAVLSVLVRNFMFEFPGGPETKLGSHTSINLRPKVAGEDGPKVPLVIRMVSAD